MQCVMWLLLGGTVGVAALQERNRQEPEVRLSTPMVTMRHDAFLIRVPAGWAREVGTPGLVVREPTDPETGASGRILNVETDLISPPMSATQYLEDKTGIAELPDTTEIEIADRPGRMFSVPETIGPAEVTIIVAGTVFNAGDHGIGLMIRLEVPGEASVSDELLMKAIAATIRFDPSRTGR